MPCINCGNKDNRFNYLCQKCYLEFHPIILSKKRIKFTICRECNAPLAHSGNWELRAGFEKLEGQIYSSLLDHINRAYKFAKGIKNLQIKIIGLNQFFSLLDKTPSSFQLGLQIDGQPDPFLPNISFSEPLFVLMKYKICLYCQKKSSSTTITAKLQIRGIERWESEIYDFVQIYAENQQAREKYEAIPIKVEKMKEGGIDLSFTSKLPVEELADELVKNYSSMLVKTKETISYDRIKSKSKYRTVISARLPNFRIGDIIRKNNFLYQILTLGGKKVRVYDFLLHEEKEVDYTFLFENFVILYLDNLNFSKLQVINTNQQIHMIELMDLETFELKEVPESALSNIQAGDIVLGFEFEDENNGSKKFFLSQINPIFHHSADE